MFSSGLLSSLNKSYQCPRITSLLHSKYFYKRQWRSLSQCVLLYHKVIARIVLHSTLARDNNVIANNKFIGNCLSSRSIQSLILYSKHGFTCNRFVKHIKPYNLPWWNMGFLMALLNVNDPNTSIIETW